ncbi:MAG TPA: DUF6484 domain-containing protein [Polyangiales bacterium]
MLANARNRAEGSMPASVKRLSRTTSYQSEQLPSRSATLAALSAKGPLVLWSGAAAPVLARTTLPRAALRGREGAEVLVTFLEGREDMPVVVGILEPTKQDEETGLSITDAVATVDGKRVLLRGAEEILLQCGEASLLLRADGSVVLRGKRVETRARRQHRIRGGSVRIN